MKQLLQSVILAAVLFFCGQIGAGATTISGTIYTTNGVRGGTVVPVAGATVWIYFNVGSNFVATTTNSAGAYSITIPASWPSSVSPYPLRYIDVRDTGGVSCQSYGQKQILYWGTNIIYDDTLCNYPWYTISGQVTMQGAGGASNAKVWLIGSETDTTGGITKTTLTAYDSTFTNSTGAYYFTKASGYFITQQYVKAALVPSDPNYASYLPTYHDSALTWNTAPTFGGSAWTSYVTNLDISLRGGVNPGGPGFIGGDVLLGANKSTNVGDALPGKIILLTTSSGKGVAYVFSDAYGHFSFTNLPYGDYKLFGDAWGKTNPPLNVTISANIPSVSNIVFEENSIWFAGKMVSLGVSANAQLKDVKVYPMPIESFLELSNLQAIAGTKTAVLRDITGAVVSRSEITANSATFRINTASLPGGIYMLELGTTAGVNNYKISKY